MNIQLQGIGANSPWNRVQMATQSINQSVRRGMGTGNQKTEEERRQDSIQLNPMNRMQNLLDSLMSQKQNIIEQKNKLIADTLEAGGDINSIQSMISLYEEQITNIETQISQTMKEMMESQLNKEDETKYEKEPETKEEQQRQQMSELNSASMDYERVGQVYSAHIHKKGEANVLTQEIKMDGSRGGTASGKQDRLNELLKEADELYTKSMKGYADLNVSLKETGEKASRRHELKSEEEADKTTEFLGNDETQEEESEQ